MPAITEEVPGLPDMKVSIRQLFGIDSDLEVPAYSEPDEHVPDVDHGHDHDHAPEHEPQIPASAEPASDPDGTSPAAE